MRIAISAQDNQGLEGVAAQHFGRCPYYVFIDVEDNQIQDLTIVDNPYFGNHAPGQVPQFIHQQGANMMVAGGMGQRAIMFFQQLGIQAYTGATGTVRQALEQALGGHLEDARPCEHDDDHEGHGHEGHGECSH